MKNLLQDKLEKVSLKSEVTKRREIKRIIEALLFSTHEPLPLSKIKEIVEITYPIRNEELKSYIQELRKEYIEQMRSFDIDEIAEGYLMRTVPELHLYVEALLSTKRGEKLSKAAVECLAIVAYRQPVTRVEIEKIRGVDSSGSIASLVERGLIEIVGKLEQPGRPVQYGTTRKFLQHFGLKNQKELKEIK